LSSLLQFVQEPVVQTPEDTSALPVLQAPPTTHARSAAHFCRQGFPGNACFEHEQNAGKCGTVR
jgi:hypothetical protein